MTLFQKIMPTQQKTIFITSFYGFIGRNLLSSGMLDIFHQEPNLRIVIFLPAEKKELYKKLFPSDKIIVEGIGGMRGDSKLDRLFGTVFAFSSDVHCWRMELATFWRRGKYVHAALLWLLSKLGHLKAFRQLVRWLDYTFEPKNLYKEYFEKYKPDLVFSTDIFRDQDIYLMREARSRRVFVLGMVRSWDNVNSKGLNRIIPDKTVVNSPVIKNEAIEYCDIKPDDIYVVGVPHYDRYVTEQRTSRAELFKKLNLDPNKKMVLISPPIRTYTYDPIAPAIVKALEPLNLQVVVRLHMMGKSNIGDLQSIPNKILIDAPDKVRDPVHADITVTDKDAYLADLLYHSDVVISHISTLTIDAAVFNKPSIFIGFDVVSKPYYESLRRFHDMEYLKRVRETGGVRLAENLNQLVDYTRQYIANPKLDEEGRKNIVNNYCGKLDGKSSKRLVDAILSCLNR